MVVIAKNVPDLIRRTPCLIIVVRGPSGSRLRPADYVVATAGFHFTLWVLLVVCDWGTVCLIIGGDGKRCFRCFNRV